MKTNIIARVQNMSKSETLNIVSQDTLERIKKTDKKPEIKVYSIAHEGQAQSTELTFGGKIKKAMEYVKDMVVKIGDRLKIGTPIFNRHAETNTTENRTQIGELIGKTVRYVGDKLSTLAAVYIYPEYKKLPLDVASFEADVEYTQKQDGTNQAIDIDNISGIALSNSEIDKPAFENATLLAVVQAFMPDDETEEQRIINRLREIRKTNTHSERFRRS